MSARRISGYDALIIAATSASSALTSANSAAVSAASAAAAVAASFDAKGDLLVGTGAGAFDQLSVAATAGYAGTRPLPGVLSS